MRNDENEKRQCGGSFLSFLEDQTRQDAQGKAPLTAHNKLPLTVRSPNDDNKTSKTNQSSATTTKKKKMSNPSTAKKTPKKRTASAQNLSAIHETSMKTVLLPTRFFGDKQGLSSGDQSNLSPRVRWTGMNPLQWIESLAGEAEKRESLANGGKAVVPIRMSGTNLSVKSPMVQKQSEKRPAQTPTAASEADSGSKNDDKGTAPSLASETDGTGDGKESADEVVAWDVSFLNDTSLSTNLVPKIQSLAIHAESMATMTGTVKSSYRRIRDHVSLEFGRIKSQSTDNVDPNHRPTLLLDDLCITTIQKMEALIAMATSKSAEDPAVSVATPTSKAATGPLNSTHSKKELAEYMSAWLRNNWTNPYPDEDGIVELAAACGTTSNVIGNWLINARTRKWRPAIVQAFEMNRPADLLKEDSLNVFNGNPVRDLPVECMQDMTEGFYSPVNKRAKRN